MDNFMTQVVFWAVVSIISFGILSYLVFTSPEYEEQEDGSLIPKD